MQNYMSRFVHSIDSQKKLPDQAASLDIVRYSFDLGRKTLGNRTEVQRKQFGQFLTPPGVARYMTQKLTSFSDECCILEPAIGSGVLACALIDRIVQIGYPKRIRIDGYEIDADLCVAAREALPAFIN